MAKKEWKKMNEKTAWKLINELINYGYDAICEDEEMKKYDDALFLLKKHGYKIK